MARKAPALSHVDARGRVRYSVFGERDWSEGPSLALVEKLVKEATSARR